MKAINRINWELVGPSSFVTLTYPDSRLCFGQKTRNTHRWQFMRKVERYCKHHVAAVWKIEWLQRQSGACLGMIAPHYHIMMFDVPWIPKETVTEWWREILDVEGALHTDIRKIRGHEGAGKYLAKYASKSCKLAIGAYLNFSFAHGRHWGMIRKPLIPLAPVRAHRKLTGAEIAIIQAYAKERFPNYDPTTGGGFTIFGRNEVERILKIEKEST